MKRLGGKHTFSENAMLVVIGNSFVDIEANPASQFVSASELFGNQNIDAAPGIGGIEIDLIWRPFLINGQKPIPMIMES